ncbi:stage III sporulation protein AA [Clostridium sp. D2Q-11]|uniref:Stage III sporulation protein AA n=1 Tax=Anaeromonas frigoriresistens TaxID=2683708 RepID=A0A942UZQ3_9FIRM|nr:stage III sporulation protein AA [Anaeromonas frigoriresistens]MBS4539996.1 stage III sporulation protein AA [Anaeromonas frigoriresistens]
MEQLKTKKYSNYDLERFRNVISRLDMELEHILRNIPTRYKESIEEIRLRVNQPLMIEARGNDYFVSEKGQISRENRNNFIISKNNIIKTFERLCEYSIYAVEDEIRNGFLTIKGGHRIGISGRVVYKNRSISTIKDISSINIRIARQKIGIAKEVIEYLVDKGSIYNTLIVSPPQCGKTTLLRDIIRTLSNGIPEYDMTGLKVAVIDERSEIGGIYQGVPQNDLGIRTDILDRVNKYDGTLMMLRSLSPNIIATDELGDKLDIDAIHNSLKAGVKILTTIHGESIEDVQSKPNIASIIKEKIFERIIILDNSEGVGTIKDIIDGKTNNSVINKQRRD